MLMLAFFSAALWALWKIPQRQARPWRGQLDPKDYVQAENDFRTTLSQIFGGVALFLGIFFTWQQLNSSSRGLEILLEGQLAERFTRAFDQVGSEQEEVRIGGIYALEKIAQDSPRDHLPIVEALQAFIRRRTLPSANAAGPATPRAATPADVLAAMTVLGRRNVRHDPEDLVLNFSSIDLTGATIENANFARANFRGAALDQATIWDTNVEQAAFWDANLQDSEWVFVDASHTSFHRADLRNSYWSTVDLFGASLSSADLRGSKWSWVSFEDVDLYRTRLEGADLRDVQCLTREQLASAMVDDTTLLPTAIYATPTPAGGAGPERDPACTVAGLEQATELGVSD